MRIRPRPPVAAHSKYHNIEKKERKKERKKENKGTRTRRKYSIVRIAARGRIALEYSHGKYGHGKYSHGRYSHGKYSGAKYHLPQYVVRGQGE